MKKLVFLFCIAMGVMSCTGNKTNVSDDVDTVSIDSIDSIGLDSVD
jgi:hypothetical protein